MDSVLEPNSSNILSKSVYISCVPLLIEDKDQSCVPLLIEDKDQCVLCVFVLYTGKYTQNWFFCWYKPEIMKQISGT
jgi:hypothetical protein